jgi:erythromycin esterase-like protein
MAADSELRQYITESARPIEDIPDIDAIVDSVKDARIVMLGEATHGTKDFYSIRSLLTKRLFQRGFNFLAVEGDWPDLQRLNRFIQYREHKSAEAIMHTFKRWPTWMWANTDILELSEWMRQFNATRPPEKRVGFFGLDIYALFESIDAILHFVDRSDPVLAQKLRRLYGCFDPFDRDEMAYARSLLYDPAGCVSQSAEALKETLLARTTSNIDSLEIFDIRQNARLVKNAERYYRIMLSADEESWNLRDRHMLETLDQILAYHGPESKCVVWAHNTHVGDYRATDMLSEGYINLGGIAREKYGQDKVKLVGFSSYQGTVVAGYGWGAPWQTMLLPPAKRGSIEEICHQAAQARKDGLFWMKLDGRSDDHPLSEARPHRAVGVVYDPHAENRSNYVPTMLSRRYDLFVFVDQSAALTPVEAKAARRSIPETYPSAQ